MGIRRSLVSILAVGFALSLVPGCGEDDNPAGPGDTTDDFDVVLSALDAYLSSGDGPTVSAQALYDNMTDGDDTNDYYVLSVRSEAHYDAGHVPGAANIPWRECADATNTATLPTDQPIAVYCYTGHTGGVATTLLRALGYDAYNMKYGMCAWTTDTDVRVASPFSSAEEHDFAVETTSNTPDTYDLPDLDLSGSDDMAIVRAAAAAYLESGDAPTLSAQTLFDNIYDGDDTNDYYVVSVRSATHYAIGHIPGAINIPWREIAEEENLRKIPADRPIAVYCYTGHTGAVATTALRMLGYDAYNMKFGMVAWTMDEAVRATSAFSEATDAHDFPVESTPL